MARTDTLSHFLTDVADAIRSKTGNSNLITASNFDTAITNIPSGGEHTGAYKVSSVSEMNAIDDMQEDDYCIIEEAILPSTYTQLEYIQGSGTQYIDTGYKPYKTKMEIKFSKPNSSNNNQFGAGCWNPNDNRYFALNYAYYDDVFKCADRQGNVYTTLGARDPNEHTLIYNDENHNVIYDGTVKATVTDLTTQATNNLLLFAMRGRNGAQDFFVGRIMYVKLTNKDTGIIERNFIPCKRNSDNAIGMYDIVNNVFYTNSGTGTFTAGSETTYSVYKYINNVWVNVD